MWASRIIAGVRGKIWPLSVGTARGENSAFVGRRGSAPGRGENPSGCILCAPRETARELAVR